MLTTTVRTVRALRMEGFVPVDFNVDSERRLVTMRFGNEVTVQDVVQYRESLRTSLACEPDFSELVDNASHELASGFSSGHDFGAGGRSVFAGGETRFRCTQGRNLPDNTHVSDGTW
jgi:hypothetical protein